MNVVSFYAPRPDHPFFRDYTPFLDLLRLSCERFGHRHIVLTDDPSVGDDAYVTELPHSLMRATVAAQLAYLEDLQFANTPTLLTGADCVLARDPNQLWRDLFPKNALVLPPMSVWDADITITIDDRFVDCRMNCGAIFIRQPAKLAPVWRKAMEQCGDDWGDDQTSVYSAILAFRDDLVVQEVPCDPFNLAPEHPGDDCRRGTVLHFRGPRKDWMVPYCHHWLGLGHGAEAKALPNMTEAEMLANVCANIDRDVPWLNAIEPHDKHAVLVGGGPSLADTLPEIRRRAADGQHIFALNGTAQYLRDNGIEPTCGVILDPRAENARFVLPGLKWLLASQCAPEVFEAAGESALMWHFPLEGAQELIPAERRDDALWIAGAISVGLTAMCLVAGLGYRKIHLYGYDSSDREDASHAYAQHETTAELKRVTAWCNGQEFKCGIAMYAQAHSFQRFAEMLAELGAIITVHGDGLLPTIARCMQQAAPVQEDMAA